MANKDALKQGEQTVTQRIEHGERMADLDLVISEIEGIRKVADSCLQILGFLKKELTPDPPPFKPTDPKAKIIVNMSKIKEAMKQ